MKLTVPHNDQNVTVVQIQTDDGIRMCGGSQGYRTMHLSGALIPTATIGGVGTEPEYRRGGLVRTIFREMAAEADRRAVPLTVLHPFSFAYYRKFGFERVADHRVLAFPTAKLDFVPRYAEVTRCTDESCHLLLAALYNRFAEGRNLLPVRDRDYPFPLSPTDKRRTYLTRDASGEPDGYIILDIENYYSVNRMVSINLNVHELVFTTPEALDKLLGFMRMFEGELDSVKLHNIAMSPEVELRLRHFMHTSITVLPDLMARINDVAALFSLLAYPTEPGRFTVKASEPAGTPWVAHADKTTGIFCVDYKDGRATVTRLSDDADYDFAADIPALTQLVFGYTPGGYAVARYTPNTVFKNPAPDFFRAFPARPGGIFEHF